MFSQKFRMHGLYQAVWVATLTLTLAGAAAAADKARNTAPVNGGVRTTVVRYGDLDLTRDEGVRALYARLRAAASRVCEPLEPRDLHLRQVHAECYQAALDDAVRRRCMPGGMRGRSRWHSSRAPDRSDDAVIGSVVYASNQAADAGQTLFPNSACTEPPVPASAALAVTDQRRQRRSTSHAPAMPPRWAKCATPEAVPVTPWSNSAAP
jgi:UrcA family protein